MPEQSNASPLPTVVIGAGAVGLACGAALARSGRWVVVVEKEDSHGRGTSSRNSEVIHAGIYYPPKSLKARLCVQGRQKLYPFLESRGVPHRRCGKLIVATEQGELAQLEELHTRARENGVEELEFLDAAAVRSLEPHVRSMGALLSPVTGIVDAHGFMDALLTELQRAGGTLALHSEVMAAEPVPDGWRLAVRGADGDVEEVEAVAVVNAAGLQADRVARLIGEVADDLPEQTWVKGNYFSVRPGAAVKAHRLIYPCPRGDLRGLGVHLTLDLGGGLRLGPDVERMAERVEDYRVDAGRGAAFLAAARRFLPDLVAEDLTPAYAGLRPQLAVAPPSRDFYIQHEVARGAPGWVNLIGIESPGLTAALAIGDHVAGLLGS